MSKEINSFNDFNGMLTAYRKTVVLRQAVECGVIDCLAQGPKTSNDISVECKLKSEEGQRFLSLLTNLGFLKYINNKYELTEFSKEFLLADSPNSQRAAIEFESKLINKWNDLSNILHNGQGSSFVNKTQDQYKEDLKVYQKAMNNAASVRAKELWAATPVSEQEGLIVDLGCGDGTYLKEFLNTNPRWNAIGCDLEDVINLNISQNDKLQYRSLNIFEQDDCEEFIVKNKAKTSIVLLSNFVHCYSEDENRMILNIAKKLLSENGILLVHDFYSDLNEFGAMYDMHMMLNTYNGRSYSSCYFKNLLRAQGFGNFDTRMLESKSAVIAAKKDIS